MEHELERGSLEVFRETERSAGLRRKEKKVEYGKKPGLDGRVPVDDGFLVEAV